MFTGLVEGIAQIKTIDLGTDSAVFHFKSVDFAHQLKIGDSISVNGACLTVIKQDTEEFSVDVMVQTLKLTSLRALKVDDYVNLERAVLVDSRLGGHIVQGHVDCTGEIVLLQQHEKSLQMNIEFPANLLRYVVAQGSICIDGVSLTVGSVSDDKNQISVWLIPETLSRTNLLHKVVGDVVNIEVDILAKYVERFVSKMSPK